MALYSRSALRLLRRLPIVVLILCLEIGCAPRYVSHWPSLTVGMSKPDVQETLGYPRSRWPWQSDRERWETIYANQGKTFGERERWIYGKKGWFGINAAFDNAFWFAVDPEEAFVVWFDAEGYVEKYSRPSRGRFAPRSTEDGS